MEDSKVNVSMHDAIREAVARLADTSLLTRADFIFQQAKDDLEGIRKLDPEDVRRLNEGYKASNVSYEKYVRDLPDTDRLKAIGDLVGRFIAGCDEKASGARFWNPERNFIAKAGIQQPVWIKHILLYIQNNGDASNLSTGVGNIIRYLENPAREVPISDNKTRQMISEHVLKKTYIPAKFVDELTTFFRGFGLQTVHPDNFTIAINSLLFGELTRFWRGTPRFWRLGTTEDGKSVWPEMLEYQVASIGWNDLGDLDQRGLTKGMIKNMLSSKGYPYRPNVLSRKAGEIVDFLTAAPHDFVVAAEGQKIKGIGKINGDYNYDPDLPTFWHTRPVEWLIVDTTFPALEEGNQTTFFELKQQSSRDLIRRMLKEIPMVENNSAPIAKISLNTILYGPPGTGKTYTTIEKALRILNEEEDIKACNSGDRDIVKTQFDKRRKERRIEFVTFHQSMSYEDFIEGIKPDMSPDEDVEKIPYYIEDGIFKQMTIRAKYAYFLEKEGDPSNLAPEDYFRIIYDEFIANIREKLFKEEAIELKTKSKLTVEVTDITERGNIKLKHNGGSKEKEYTVSRNRLLQLFLHFPSLNSISNIDKEFRAVIGGSNATAYWSVLNKFIEVFDKTQIEIKQNSEIELFDYGEIKKTVEEFYISKELVEEVHAKPYVIIIDEINRGNISQIFGELITLIEDDKRLGKDEFLDAKLPYSKKPFGVPPNLYIIGTMNTADRSVEALDTALRRRFSFEEMPPRPELPKLSYEVVPGVLAADLLRTINQRLEKLLDRDHLLGHSYFIRKEGRSMLDAFYRNIIPLLQEYFFGDYGKIGLVLGSGFVQKKEWENKTDGFAEFPDFDNGSDYHDREVFEIINYGDKPHQALTIGKSTVGMDFTKAIKLLMKQPIE